MLASRLVFASGLYAGAVVLAQQVPAPPPTTDADLARIMPDGAAGNAVVRFMSAEFGVPGKTVKGVPYQATAVTETTQTLADGNRIVRKSTALLARDSEGRTRREQKIDAVGQWSVGDQMPPLVFINDPVTQVHYVLEPNTKVARKMISSGQKSADEAKMLAHTKVLTAGPGGGMIGGNVFYEHRKVQPGEAEPADIVNESLGSKTIEGIVAEGTRLTRTIPAGKIGNDRPLTSINETWYSSELGMIVMSRHSDPQMGETVYTLTNIQRSEPDPSLFTVPADYTVKEGGPLVMMDKHEN